MKHEEEGRIVRSVPLGRLIDEAATLPLSISDPLFELTSDERRRFSSEPSSPDVPDPAEQVMGDGDSDDTSDVAVFRLCAERAEDQDMR